MNVFEQAMELCRSHDYHLGPEGCGPAALIDKLEAAGLFRSDEPEPDEVMAFRTHGNNADIIADCLTLGYIGEHDLVLDSTYGLGAFWSKYRPKHLFANDLDSAKGDYHDDFANLHWADASFDVAVFDPPFKMQGTSSNAGPATSNAAYGMDRKYRSITEQFGSIGAGLAECHRVTRPNGVILVKCMSAVVSGAVVWQDRVFADAVEQLGARLIDRFWLLGYRKQPERTHKCPHCKGDGFVENPNYCCPDDEPPSIDCESCEGSGREVSVQQHARQNASCLLVFRKGTS